MVRLEGKHLRRLLRTTPPLVAKHFAAVGHLSWWAHLLAKFIVDAGEIRVDSRPAFYWDVLQADRSHLRRQFLAEEPGLMAEVDAFS